jgi:hypothetical protein
MCGSEEIGPAEIHLRGENTTYFNNLWNGIPKESYKSG